MIGIPRALGCGLAMVLAGAVAIRAAQVPMPAASATLPPEQIEGARMYQEYQSGDSDKAVDYFARLWRQPLAAGREVTGGPSGYGPALFHPGGYAGLDRLMSLLFDTEVLMRAGVFGKYAMSAPLQSAKGSIGLNGMFEVNSLIVYRAVEGEADRPLHPSPDLPASAPGLIAEAVRGWYVITTSHCLRWQLDCADALLAAAERRFGADPEILLLAGAEAESRGRTTAAEGLLRRAIAGGGSMPEAHLRLGRVLVAAGRTTEGRRELDRALADARQTGDAGVVYFASVTLAELDAGAGRTTSAKAHTAEASALKPFAHPLFAGLTPAAIYRAAEFYQQPRRLAALRTLMRR